MLVATPGQTTTYSLLGSSAPKKTCLNSPATAKSTNVNNSSVVNNNCSTSNAASTLMKTIQVRLNRGTEFLKDTVQKALISTTTTNSNNTSSSGSSITFRNNKTNNINTTVVGAFKHVHVASAVPSRNTIINKSANSTTLATGASTSGGAIVRTSIATNVSKTLKPNTVPPTKIHRYSQERQETSSTDSINKEMCHFKPILPAPTARWKCGSKSRGGAAIRKPLACLATNIKNLKCDDCSKLTDDSSEEEQEVAEDDTMEESPTHLGKSHPFKPKPSSTLLTTIVTSPSHQSAFVRLVAQMKTLVNIHQTTMVKSQKRFSKKKSPCKTIQTSTRLGRTSKTASGLKMQQLPKSPIKVPLTHLILRSRKQSFTQVNNLNLSTNLIIKKSRTKTTEAASSNTSKSTITPKNKKGPLQITTKKGKRNTTKSKVINIVAFAKEKIPTPKSDRTVSKCNSKIEATVNTSVADVKPKQRKRKHIEESLSTNETIDSAVAETAVTDVGEEIAMPPVRKSARLSKNGNDDSLRVNAVKHITIRRRNARGTHKHSSGTFSPPMTRSRVKELMQKQGKSSVERSEVQLKE